MSLNPDIIVIFFWKPKGVSIKTGHTALVEPALKKHKRQEHCGTHASEVDNSYHTTFLPSKYWATFNQFLNTTASTQL